MSGRAIFRNLGESCSGSSASTQTKRSSVTDGILRAQHMSISTCIGIVAGTAELARVTALALPEALPNRLVARSLRHFARREILAHPFFKGVHDLKVRDAPCDSERGRAVLRRAGRHACDS